MLDNPTKNVGNWKYSPVFLKFWTKHNLETEQLLDNGEHSPHGIYFFPELKLDRAW